MEDTGNKEQSSDVGQQRDSNGKLLGGVTGKGFLPGQSGNPEGRRKNSVSPTSVLRATITQNEMAEIIRNLIDAAISKPKPKQYTIKGGASYKAFDSTEVKHHEWAIDTIINRLDGKISFSSDLDGGAVSEIIVRYDKQAAHAAD